MKFTVEILPAAQKEISELEYSQQKLLKNEYSIIENKGIEFVKIRPLQDKIYEIKTNELRTLFKYQEGRVVLVGVVFEKKSQKTPKEILKLAKNRLRGL